MKHTTFETLEKCPVCQSASLSEYKKIKDHSVSGEIFSLQKCTSCSFIFTNPRPDEVSVGSYYESEEYISHSNTTKGLLARIYQLVRSRTIRNKRVLIESFAGSKSKILDYGCGTGEFLNEMDQSGWECIGLEPNEKAASHAKDSYQLNVKSPMDLSELEKGDFQAITLWHVLEHVHKLTDTLALLREKLNDNGIMAIAVPNQASWDACHYSEFWAAYDVPRHLYHFGPNSMGTFLSNSGFKLKKIIPMKWDSYYVALLSEKYKGNPLGPLFAFMTGLWTNFSGSRNINKYSSLIYVVEKSHD